MDDFLPRQWPLRAWPAIVAGLYWLCIPGDFWPWLFAVLPGAALLASGLALLFRPGAAMAPRFMALGGVLGVVLAIPSIFITGFWFAVIGALLSLLCFLCAGRESLLQAGLPKAVEAPPLNWRTDAKAALDEALVAYFIGFAKMPSGQRAVRGVEQVKTLEQAMKHASWARVDRFHRAPPPPDDVETRSARAMRQDFQRVSFTSGYEPPAELPLAPDWLTGSSNSRCHLRVFRQSEPGRPWLLGIHGYRMGYAWMDFGLFPPDTLVHKHHYNLVLPVLPLHGARKEGRRSGDYYLDGELTAPLYAEAQALWDLRRTVAWIRAEEPEARIGVVGYSLGGYNAALLATQEKDLDFVVAGIPVADFSVMLWDHLPPANRRYFINQGMDAARYARVLRPVSPLARAPRLPRERLAIIAGSADRLVPPEQPLRLAEHWQVPVHWYPGGHLTFNGEPAVTETLRAAAAAAGWDRSDPSATGSV